MENTKSKPLVVKVVRVATVCDRQPKPFWYNPAYLLGTGTPNQLAVQSNRNLPISKQEGVWYDHRGRIIQEPPPPQYLNSQA